MIRTLAPAGATLSLAMVIAEKFAKDAATLDGWPGLLIGDMSQPRGGPMPTGHASHQIGLDVDICLSTSGPP